MTDIYYFTYAIIYIVRYIIIDLGYIICSNIVYKLGAKIIRPKRKWFPTNKIYLYWYLF